MKNGGHAWSANDTRCERCGCRREDYEDNLVPFCNPALNRLAVFKIDAVRRWNGYVYKFARRIESALTIKRRP